MTSCRHHHTMVGDARVYEHPVAEQPEAVNARAHGGTVALEICRECGHWRWLAWNGEQYERGDWHRHPTYGEGSRRR